LKKNVHEKAGSSNAVTWAVFIATLEIVLISITSVVFPALVVRTASRIVDNAINPWEPGVWAFPLIISNLIILGIGIAYYKKKLPPQITKSIQLIFNFEVSKRVAFIVLAVLFAIYIPLTINELYIDEDPIWADYAAVRKTAEEWSIDKVTEGFGLHFRFFLLSSSIELFDNIRVVPFLVSICLLVLTYFITLEITRKRFAGLVAFAILLQSPVFLEYDTTSTYENVWTILYILSLYTIYKAWQASALTYTLSLFSKPLTAAFFPMTLFFLYRADVPKKRKIRTIISYLVVLVMGLVAITVFKVNLGQSTVEYFDLYFWQGFTSMAYQLRYDFLVLIFLLPLVIGLFLAARRGIVHADSIMVLIAGILLSAPILTGFTTLTNQPYRYVPLVIFFAMGVGVILSKRKQLKEQA